METCAIPPPEFNPNIWGDAPVAQGVFYDAWGYEKQQLPNKYDALLAAGVPRHEVVRILLADAADRNTYQTDDEAFGLEPGTVQMVVDEVKAYRREKAASVKSV